jgi:type II secretion system protein G
MKRNRKGFTLIELLIVVAIIGIIVAIAIPNLLNAIQRAKQKRTMADMRSIGTATEAYAIDNNRYPPSAAAAYPSGCTTTAPITGTPGYISPIYIQTTPINDGWADPFQYAANTNGSQYVIVSYGKDNAAEAVTISAGPTTSFNCDIIFSNGQFTRFPDGIQK